MHRVFFHLRRAAAALAALAALAAPAAAQVAQIRVSGVKAEARRTGTSLTFTINNRDTIPLDGFVAQFSCNGLAAYPPHDSIRVTIYYQLAPYGERPRDFERAPGSYHWISAKPDGRVPAQGSNTYSDVLTGLHFLDREPFFFFVKAISCHAQTVFPQYSQDQGQGRGWPQPWGGSVGPSEPWQWPNPPHPTFSPSYRAPEERTRPYQSPPWAAPPAPTQDSIWF